MGFLTPTVKINITNPRTDEFTLSNSQYGRMIPIPFGTVRLDGNIIWSDPVREEKVTTTKKSGGKGGKKKTKTTTTTYFYYGSFAISFGEGVARQVRRIWADSKLIYDATGAGDTSALDLTFRFYGGDEEQLPDSLIESSVGEDLAPAYRGQCYIVFDEMSLENFGNRIPNIEAEIEYFTKDVSGDSANELSGSTLSYSPALATSSFRADWDRGFLYCSTQSTSQIMVISTLGPTQVGLLSVGQVGALYSVIPRTGELVTKNGTSMEVRNQFNATILRSGTPSPAIDLLGPGTPPIARTLVQSAGTLDVLFSRNNTNIEAYNLGDFTSFGTIAPIGGGTLSFISSGSVGGGDVYYAEITSSLITFFKATIVQFTSTFVGGFLAVTALGTVAPADLLGGSSFTVPSSPDYLRPSFDPTLNSIFFNLNVVGVGAVAARFSLLTSDIVWTTATTDILTDPWAMDSMRMRGNRYIYEDSNDDALSFNASNGQQETLVFPAGAGITPVYLYDDANLVLYASDDLDDELFRSNLTLAVGTGLTVAEVGERVCLKSGLQLTADFVTTDVEAISLPGYVIREQMTGEQSLRPLSQLFRFDVISSDYKLNFLQRSLTISATLTDDDLIRTESNRQEPYVESRTQEADIPAVYEVSYQDIGNAYQPNTQRAQRVRGPDVSMYSDNTTTLDIDAALLADMAKQAAEVLLYTDWNERLQFAWRTSWEFIYLDPSDSVQLDLGTVSIQVRLANADIGADLSLESTSVSETQGQYTSTAIGETGSNNIQVGVPSITPSELFLLGTPLIRDVDDAGQSLSRLYVSASNYGQATWPGCEVLSSANNAEFVAITQHDIEAPWGVTATAIADPNFENTIDPDDTFDLTVVSGLSDFSSITESELYEFGNTLAVVKSDGEIELLQFLTVQVVSGNLIRLSGLLRGRRGTDVFSGGHSVGEQCILLERDWVESTTLAIGELNSDRAYKAPTNGTFAEDTLTTVYTAVGNDLKPYAPVKVASTIDVSDDINITWIRRTRIGGELLNSDDITPIEVPLSESAELYDIEFRDGIGGAVLSNITQTDLTSESADITLAALNAELTVNVAAGDDIAVRVFQKSGNTQIGRGFVREATITLVFT